MATSKEYGLIFEDEKQSVKMVRVFSEMGMFDNFCTTPLINDLNEKFEKFLDENNLHPAAVYPDTALCGGDYNSLDAKIRDAQDWEREELLEIYLDEHPECDRREIKKIHIPWGNWI